MISVTEQQLRRGRRGKLLRPFCRQAQVHPRGYSTLLQRVLTDFGAETAFGQVPVRVREHYGISVPTSAVRERTLQHAQAAWATSPPSTPSALADTVIAEMDGSLIPLLDNEPPPATTGNAPAPAPDRRRHKRLFWKEVRLCAAQAAGRVQAYYAATMDSVLAVGLAWEAVAARAGLGPPSRVHGVGDGAEWIADQFALRFGGQGRYLVDFYHVSEYLAAAAPHCGAGGSADWLTRQTERLKANQLEALLQDLAVHVEPAPTAAVGVVERARDEKSATPVRDCQRYLSKRRASLDYAGALARGLPIGSGLIESGHRHVVQARLKRAGAWWKPSTAKAMVALRVLRANGDWEHYWRPFPHHLNN